MVEPVLENIYFNLNNPSCFSSIKNLYKEAKKELPSLSRHEVQEWLSKQEAYSLHKPATKRFLRNPVVVNGVDIQWEIDLVDLSMLKSHNDQYKYLLQVIDVGSRYGFSLPIKTKQPEVVAAAFEKILKQSNRKPVIVASDAGKEFTAKYFQNMLRKHKIYFFVPTSDSKCPIVERWNRTIKTRMWKYFTHNNTFRYLDILPSLIRAYNNSFHRMLSCKPSEVTEETAHVVAQRLKNRPEFKGKSCPVYKFSIGDRVRLSKRKEIFEKGYEANWTREIFIVYDHAAKPLPVYRVKDLQGQKIAGYMYENQLQKAEEPKIYKIDKVLRWREKAGKKQGLVRWLGYGPEFDQWIDKSELIRL